MVKTADETTRDRIGLREKHDRNRFCFGSCSHRRRSCERHDYSDIARDQIGGKLLKPLCSVIRGTKLHIEIAALNKTGFGQSASHSFERLAAIFEGTQRETTDHRF